MRENIMGMGTTAFAQEIGISKTAVSLYESDNKKPSRETTIMISEITGVSADYIMGITDEMFPSENNSAHKDVSISDLIIELGEEHPMIKQINSIRNSIKEKRKQLGWSYKDLAE
ncbi:helix-turn-helix transcriptional regulator [Bacillus thuringiensis]|uniref:helix-turn-helix domain-containing protein n=1 Tax=Bacillus thuringiensis TaxID=1428 RepID=UPI0030BA22FC